jgi:hypothetical protein
MNGTDTANGGAQPAIGFFERYLTVWVALCIARVASCSANYYPSSSSRLAEWKWLRSIFRSVC